MTNASLFLKEIRPESTSCSAEATAIDQNVSPDMNRHIHRVLPDLPGIPVAYSVKGVYCGAFMALEHIVHHGNKRRGILDGFKHGFPGEPLVSGCKAASRHG